MVTLDVDSFLLAKIDKKLDYWTTIRLNSAKRAMIANNVLISSLLYFLGIWGGTNGGIKHIKRKVRNFFWTGSPSPSQACIAWNTLCLQRCNGGLNLIDPQEVMLTMMAKWMVAVCEPAALILSIFYNIDCRSSSFTAKAASLPI
jgi:hypothetical protein